MPYRFIFFYPEILQRDVKVCAIPIEDFTTVTLLSITLGMVIGWTSPYIAKLTNEDSPLYITETEASWVASLMPLGRLFGAVAGSITVEYLGSKTSVLLSGVPLIVGWICIIFANTVSWLYVSRIFSGASMGMIFTCFPLYIGEISAPSIRGALVSLILNGMPLGTLIGNVMGAHLSMMWFGIISLILNLCYIAIFPFLPQSPHHFVRHDDLAGAKKAIQWYQRRSDVTRELETVEIFIRSSRSMSFQERILQIVEPKYRRAFLAIVLLFIFMQFSGLNSIVFYMEIIVRRSRVTSISPSTVVVLVNGIGIIIGWIGMYLVDRCGRRILLAVSSCGVIIGMALLGLHFTLLELHYDSANLEWLPIISLFIFMLMCMGLTLVPSTMLSELFPSDLKSIAGFVGSVTSALFAFIASKTYQPLVNLMAEQYVVWIYAVIMIISLIYAIVGLPETKGKTLQEIQEMLAGVSHQETSDRSRESKIGENQQGASVSLPQGSKT